LDFSSSDKLSNVKTAHERLNPFAEACFRSPLSVTLYGTSNIFCSAGHSNPLFVDKPAAQIASNSLFLDKWLELLGAC